MLDLSEEPLEENIEICERYLTSARMSRIGMTLELELGVTGGEEDGVDNSGVDSAKPLHATGGRGAGLRAPVEDQPRTSRSPHRSANVHGVYKPGNVKLQPIILKELAGLHPAEIRHPGQTRQLRLPRRFWIDARGNPVEADLLRRDPR